MKRYVLLIIIIIVVLIYRNHWMNIRLNNQVVVLSGQVDSLKSVTYFYESQVNNLAKNLSEIGEIGLDSVNYEIKARDSAIFSHDQQIRWLQWHVERLNKLKTNKP